MRYAVGLTYVSGLLLLVLLFCLHWNVSPTYAAAQQTDRVSVLQFTIKGGIGPAQTSLTQSVMTKAEKDGHHLVQLRLDTPGGLVSSMRDIVQAILNSPVPVLVWVGPSGARAASAGVFIVAASSVAGMAPQTTMGAASPVGPGGSDIESTMQKKVINDLSSLVRAVAGKQNRNVAWYEEAVKKAVSITASEAVAKQVIEIVAASERDFLAQAGMLGVPLSAAGISTGKLDGFSRGPAHEIATPPTSLATPPAPHSTTSPANTSSAPPESASGTGAEGEKGQISPPSPTTNGNRLYFGADQIDITEYQPDWRHSFLAWLLDPQVAYLLFIAGIGCLFLEFTHAGAILPGVLGAFCLLLGLYALTILPANATGILLILLGLVLFIMELKIPSYGLLSVGATASLFMGSVILFPSGEVEGVNMQLPMSTILPTVLTIAAVMGGAAFVAVRALRSRPATGSESFAGGTAQVRQWSGSAGRVLYQGTTWRARFPESKDIQRGLLAADVVQPYGDATVPERDASVTVLALDGLTLIVTQQFSEPDS